MLTAQACNNLGKGWEVYLALKESTAKKRNSFVRKLVTKYLWRFKLERINQNNGWEAHASECCLATANHHSLTLTNRSASDEDASPTTDQLKCGLSKEIRATNAQIPRTNNTRVRLDDSTVEQNAGAEQNSWGWAERARSAVGARATILLAPRDCRSATATVMAARQKSLKQPIEFSRLLSILTSDSSQKTKLVPCKNMCPFIIVRLFVWNVRVKNVIQKTVVTVSGSDECSVSRLLKVRVEEACFSENGVHQCIPHEKLLDIEQFSVAKVWFAGFLRDNSKVTTNLNFLRAITSTLLSPPIWVGSLVTTHHAKARSVRRNRVAGPTGLGCLHHGEILEVSRECEDHGAAIFALPRTFCQTERSKVV